jgi:hypothetical protein
VAEEKLRIRQNRDELGSVESVIELADFEASFGVKDCLADLDSAWLKLSPHPELGNIIPRDQRPKLLSEIMCLPTTECFSVLGFCVVFPT